MSLNLLASLIWFASYCFLKNFVETWLTQKVRNWHTIWEYFVILQTTDLNWFSAEVQKIVTVRSWHIWLPADSLFWLFNSIDNPATQWYFCENIFLGPQTQDIKDRDLLASQQKVVIVRSWHMMTSCSSLSYLIFVILATHLTLHLVSRSLVVSNLRSFEVCKLVSPRTMFSVKFVFALNVIFF